MIHQIDIINMREQMQIDADCILDGIQDDNCLTLICQMIVDHTNELLEKGRE